MRIGIVGSELIGAAMGAAWRRAGHEVLFTAPASEALERLTGPLPGTGSSSEVVSFGDAVLIAMPFDEMKSFGALHSPQLRDRLVIEIACQRAELEAPTADHDGRSALKTSSMLRTWFPEVGMVRAYSATPIDELARVGHRLSTPRGILLASDDEAMLQRAARLIADADFHPVLVADLDRIKASCLAQEGSAGSGVWTELRHTLDFAQPRRPDFSDMRRDRGSFRRPY